MTCLTTCIVDGTSLFPSKQLLKSDYTHIKYTQLVPRYGNIAKFQKILIYVKVHNSCRLIDDDRTYAIVSTV